MSEPALKCENNTSFKQYKTVYCFYNGLFVLFLLRGKFRFTKITPKKVLKYQLLHIILRIED